MQLLLIKLLKKNNMGDYPSIGKSKTNSKRTIIPRVN